MNDFPVRAPEQLTSLLQSLRKSSDLTQSDLAAPMGWTQQNLSQLERNAAKMSAASMLKLLGAKTPDALVRMGKGQVVIDYIDSISGGATG